MARFSAVLVLVLVFASVVLADFDVHEVVADPTVQPTRTPYPTHGPRPTHLPHPTGPVCPDSYRQCRMQCWHHPDVQSCLENCATQFCPGAPTPGPMPTHAPRRPDAMCSRTSRAYVLCKNACMSQRNASQCIDSCYVKFCVNTPTPPAPSNSTTPAPARRWRDPTPTPTPTHGPHPTHIPHPTHGPSPTGPVCPDTYRKCRMQCWHSPDVQSCLEACAAKYCPDAPTPRPMPTHFPRPTSDAGCTHTNPKYISCKYQCRGKPNEEACIDTCRSTYCPASPTHGPRPTHGPTHGPRPTHGPTVAPTTVAPTTAAPTTAAPTVAPTAAAAAEEDE